MRLYPSRLAGMFLILFTVINQPGRTQFLSNLAATSDDPIFTTYAAPVSRSEYTSDQAYHLMWYDEEQGVEFISTQGPNLGLAVYKEERLYLQIRELYMKPVITTSYSDIVSLHYYPFKELRVEVTFAVYSSNMAVVWYRFINEGKFPLTFSALPYLYFHGDDTVSSVGRLTQGEGFNFSLSKSRDGWMKAHAIPLDTQFRGIWSVHGALFPEGYTYIRNAGAANTPGGNDVFERLSNIAGMKRKEFQIVEGMVRRRTYTIQPGESTRFFVTAELCPEGRKTKRCMGVTSEEIIEPEKILREDEQAFEAIPKLAFQDKEQEMLYWSAFSLLRQCMMPPEGRCRYNYYIFSREPRWGWGYGGQVFHESLAMLAYAYMDPAGAMNSQRVFMDRQEENGYIPYRSGPYLDEKIVTGGVSTTSAPWFSYENLELFRITGDRKFLREAYSAGGRLYRYFLSQRDSNRNGLCSWGGHAELESVRDARVAVWDNVGWAANFEGPDLNAMLVKESSSLAEMAKILGKSSESVYWDGETEKRKRLINTILWDSETKFYYNVTTKDQGFTFNSADDLKIKEIIGFLPLWAGVADTIQARWLHAKMTDPQEFWRPYGVPSLSAADAYYCPIGYWNGPVWVQWQYLLYRGLRDYGYRETATELSRRVMSTMIYHLKKDHDFWEFYSADDLQAGWNRSYSWAGVIARFMIDEASANTINPK